MYKNQLYMVKIVLKRDLRNFLTEKSRKKLPIITEVLASCTILQDAGNQPSFPKSVCSSNARAASISATSTAMPRIIWPE